MTITVDDVKNIYGNAEAIDDDAIDDVISIVNELVEVKLVNSGYSDTMVNAIKRYLAAHFLAIGYENGGLIRQRTGDSEERYREISLETSGLGLTNYGQQALTLDLNGLLTDLATAPVKAQFRII